MNQYIITQDELDLLEYALVAMKPPTSPQEQATAQGIVERVTKDVRARGIFDDPDDD